MKLVHVGQTFAEYRTLQRLMLLADEIGFIDRPSVTFPNWGTVGYASEMRRYTTEGQPVRFSVHEPPSGPAGTLYNRFIERDLANPRFIQTFADGLVGDDRFSGKFIQPEADYSGTKGSDLRRALVGDISLGRRTYADPENVDFRQSVETPQGREHLFKMYLIEASIQVTSAMFVAERTSLLPVSDDPFMSTLLALRTADAPYVGATRSLTPLLGLAIAQAVIPDAALDQLEIPAILDYRAATRDAYHAWSVEIERLSAMIEETEPGKVRDRINSVMATEIAPKLVEYQNEMKSARDRMFGDLIKAIAKWELPSLSLAYIAGLNLSSALALFAAAAAPAVPAVVDYFQARRDSSRKHAISYLIGVRELK